MRIILIASLFLASCGPRPVKVQTVEIRVPYAVPCIDRIEYDRIIATKPAPVKFVPDAREASRQATAQGLRWREVALDLQAVMTGCIAK
jgi:hypothetical protein